MDTPKKIIFDNYDCVVSDIYIPLENLYVYKFQLQGEKQIAFTAGQYVSLIVPGSTPAPFSIASSPTKTTEVELAIEITGGPHTSKIKMLSLGDHVTLRGAFGNFVLQPEEKNVAFLAGGVGITPFISMLRWIRDTKQDIKATLFYSCRVRGQFLWMDELEAMQREFPNIKIIFTLTRDDAHGWQHKKGRIDENMIREALPSYEDTVFYSCGPTALIEAMHGVLIGMGLPEEQFKREKW